MGRTQTELGYDVEIAATTERDAPAEQRDGDLVIRRYRPSGIFARPRRRRKVLHPIGAFREAVST